jgi:hypothetical protein
MPQLIVFLEVWCSCGAGLCNQSRTVSGRKHAVIVEPCQKCLENVSYGLHPQAKDVNAALSERWVLDDWTEAIEDEELEESFICA